MTDKLEELDALEKALEAIAEKDEVLSETYTVSALADACLNEAGLLRKAAAMLRALAEDNARLREAVKPFAALSGEFDESWSDTDQLVVEFDEHGEGGNGFIIHRFSVGEARRARAALGSPPDA